MDDFDVETMNILLEQSASVRSSVGKQMGHLMKEGILTTEQFLEGFKEIAEVAADLATDVPKVWLYLAEILVPMLSTEALSFSDLKTAATGRHQLDVEILRLLLEEKGPGWIWQRLDEAGMSLKDFASGDSVDRVVKENKLEFTVGDTAALSAEAIHAKLLQMLQGAPATTDEQTKWISQPVTKCESQHGEAKNGANKTDVKLHEAENPWKPAWLRGSEAEQDETADLSKYFEEMTIDQINREAEREVMMEMQMPPGGGGGSRDNWGEYRRRRSEDSWQSVQRKNLDTSRLRIKPSDLMNLSLGESNQFSAWSQGAGQDSDLDRSAAFPQTSDTFAALRDVEDKKSGIGMFRVGTPPVEKQQPPPSASPAPSTTPARAASPPPRPASPEPEIPPPVKEKEKGGEEAEGEKEKEQKLVAAGNEANVKVSAVALKEKKEAEIIDDILPKEMYTEDQWSPFNPNGKKKYERDFLIKLKDTAEAKKKPEIHSDILNWLSKDKVNRMPYGAGSSRRGGGGGRGDRGGDTRRYGGPSEDGWQSVQRKNLDTSKLRSKPSDLMNVSLGGSNQFLAWWQGADHDSDLHYRPAFPQWSNVFLAVKGVADKKSSVSMFRPSYGKQPPSSNEARERALNAMRNFVSAEKEERQARTASSGASPQSSSHDGSWARQTPALSSSQSRDELAAAAQPVASGYSAISDRDTRKNLPHLSLDQVAKKIQFILEEFINNNDYQESALSVSETFPPSNMGDFVVETMNILLERSAPVRSSVGKLLGHLMKEGILTTEQFLEGFKEIAEVADDLAIDVPKVWLYLAETLVPMLSMEALSFSDLKTAATGLHKLVVEILRLLVKEKGPGWIRQRWDVAGMSWKDFAPADSIDRIVKENKLEFTVDDAAALSAEAIHAKLLQMMRPEQGAPATTNEVTKWISANVGDRAKTPEFIRVLTTAVCESAYQASSSMKIKEALFSRYSTLLQKYIDTSEELGLHCLYAVQELNHRLEQPSGLLCSLFQSLWDYGCVANETFLKWEQSKDPAFLQGKGIALKSLTAFFTALREADDELSEE